MIYISLIMQDTERSCPIAICTSKNHLRQRMQFIQAMPLQPVRAYLLSVKSSQRFDVLPLIFIRFDHKNCVALLCHFIGRAAIVGPQVRKALSLYIQDQKWPLASIGGPVIDTRLQKKQAAVRTCGEIEAKRIFLYVHNQFGIFLVLEYRQSAQIVQHGCFRDRIDTAQCIALWQLIEFIPDIPYFFPEIPARQCRKITFPICHFHGFHRFLSSLYHFNNII